MKSKTFTYLSFVVLIICSAWTNVFAGGYASSAVQQASTAGVALGSTNQVILRVSVTAANGGGSCGVSSIAFTMQNTNNANVTSAKLYYTTNSTTFSTATLKGTINNPTGTISFTNIAVSGISGETQYFWLAFDISPTVTGVCTNNVDAYVATSGLVITGTGAGSYTPTTPNPTGNRLIEGPGCWTYCTANGGGLSTVGYIKNVNFNNASINRTSVFDNYVNTGLSATVIKSISYPLSITRTANAGYTMFVSAWIDFNNDGDFADSGEQVFISTGNNTSGDVSYNTLVTIPAGAYTGTTRMRVMSTYSSAPFTDGCDVTSYNDVEDYSIVIAPLVNCSGTPTAGSVTPATSSITSAQSVTLSWSQTHQAGFTYQWQSASSSSGPWTNISGATSSNYTVSGLSAGTFYFRIIVTCTNSGLSATSASAQVNVTLVYCTPATTNCTPNFTGGCGLQYLVIKNVTLGALNNNSSATTCGTNGYTDYTGLSAPNLNIGQTYNLSITVGATTCGANTAMAWFDFNQNGDFGDAGESFFLGTVASNSTVTIPVSIPTTASIGTTRMRIKYLFDMQILSSWHCYDNSTFGETEDYSVNLQCTPTPLDVGGKFPANGLNLACGSAATLGWNSHTCATGFKVYLGTTNPPTTLVSTQSSNSYYTGNLASNTTYYWKIVPFNATGDGASSTWSFITNTAINTAISQDESGCSDGGLTLTAGGGAFPDYYWYNVPVGGSPIASGTTFTPTGLTGPTTYYVSNVLAGPSSSINASSTAGIICSTTDRGWGNMADIQAKTANLTITQVSVMFRALGTGSQPTTRPVKVYYRPSSYIGFSGSSSGWTLLMDNPTFAVPANPTGPTTIDFPDFFVPAGMTYAIYVVYDQEYASSAGLFANADLELITGTSICGSEFGNVINDRTFRGTLYYQTSCSSPTIPVVATPWVSNSNIVLASATTTGLVERCTEGGWTYYANPSDLDKWLFAIKKNGNTFTATVDITKGTSVYQNINTTAQHGSFLLPRYWNVNLTSGSINSALPVGVRFFFDTAEVTSTVNLRNSVRATSYPTTSPTAWRWFKSDGVAFSPSVGIDGNIFNFPNVTPTVTANLTVSGASYTGFINNVAYVELDGITSFSGGTGGVGFSPYVGGVLPVELLSFNAVVKKDDVLVSWNTASEKDCDYFTVEKTIDGETYEEVGIVKGSGTTDGFHDYKLTDQNPYPGVSYYRLKQTDFNGNYEYSQAVAVKFAEKFGEVQIIPNPVSESAEVVVEMMVDSKIGIRILDYTGKLVSESTMNASKGINRFRIKTEELPSGMYFILLGNDTETQKLKFVKN